MIKGQDEAGGNEQRNLNICTIARRGRVRVKGMKKRSYYLHRDYHMLCMHSSGGVVTVFIFIFRLFVSLPFMTCSYWF